MLSVLARRPLLARALTASLTSSLRTYPSRYLHLLPTSSTSIASLLRASALPASRHFANAARSPSPATTSADLSSPPAASPSPATDATTTPSSASTSDSPAPAVARRKRGRVALTVEQRQAAEKRAGQLLRAKQQERARKERERMVAQRLKKQHSRIVLQEKARERATLVRQRRQHTKDQLRAKAAREKQHRAEERAVAQQYKALQSTRPKRPLSPFIAFTQSLRSSLPASDGASGATKTAQLLAGRWHQLSAEEKRKWSAEYHAAIPAYEQQLQQWNEQQRAHRPPPRPLNIYARYASQRIKDLQAAEGGGQRASVLMKRVATEWKSLSADEKERLRRDAKNDMAAYAEQMKEWEKRPTDELAMWRLQRVTQKRKRERRKARVTLRKQAADKLTNTTTQ